MTLSVSQLVMSLKPPKEHAGILPLFIELKLSLRKSAQVLRNDVPGSIHYISCELLPMSGFTIPIFLWGVGGGANADATNKIYIFECSK